MSGPPLEEVSRIQINRLSIAAGEPVENASSLATPRLINGVAFDGSADIAVPAVSGSLAIIGIAHYDTKGAAINSLFMTGVVTAVTYLDVGKSEITITEPDTDYVVSVTTGNKNRARFGNAYEFKTDSFQVFTFDETGVGTDDCDRTDVLVTRVLI